MWTFPLTIWLIHIYLGFIVALCQNTVSWMLGVWAHLKEGAWGHYLRFDIPNFSSNSIYLLVFYCYVGHKYYMKLKLDPGYSGLGSH